MRFTYVTAAAGMLIAVLLFVPVVLMGASSAHADLSGYRRCVGNITEVPLSEPDPQVCSSPILLRWISNLVLPLLQKLTK